MTRTITTPADLDAAPDWSVVEDVEGVAWVKHPAEPDRTDAWVSRYGDALSSVQLSAHSPLTVTHDPSAPAVQPVASHTAVEAAALVISQHEVAWHASVDGRIHCECGVVDDSLGGHAVHVAHYMFAAFPYLTAEPLPEATDWQELAREHEAVLCGDADATERLRRRVEGYFADEAAQPAPEASHAIGETDDQTGQVVDERDHAEGMADCLAARLAEVLGRPDALGDHSSANDPWQNALDLASAPVASRVEVAEVLAGHRWAGTKGRSHDEPEGIRWACECGFEQNIAGMSGIGSWLDAHANHVADALRTRFAITQKLDAKEAPDA